ncbi:MAG: DUF6036 family nucleotidyltransferase [Chthoniobacteraceae bacterium]
MRLRSLIHVVRITQIAARSDRIVVFGSSSLLAFFPELGEPGGPLESSFDADLLLDPCEEALAAMMDEAIGQDRKFHAHFGYYADFLRPGITNQLPPGWEERLAPVPECDGVFSIEPHDLAVAKLHAGRPKDIDLLAFLLQEGYLDEQTLRTRLKATVMQERVIIFTHRNLDAVVAKGRGGESASGPPS